MAQKKMHETYLDNAPTTPFGIAVATTAADVPATIQKEWK